MANQSQSAPPFAIVVMGVSGSGKSSVGNALAERLGVPFVDGDDLHPEANVEKMSKGTPLTDDDRWPWLDIIGATVAETAASEGGIVAASSALRKIYRERLSKAAGLDIVFAHLDGTKELISGRMADRKGHFMPQSLLDSQFATLERPDGSENALAVAIDQPVDDIVDSIVARLPRPDQE